MNVLSKSKFSDTLDNSKLDAKDIADYKISLSNCLFDATYKREIMGVLHEKNPHKIPLYFYLEYFEKIGFVRNDFAARKIAADSKESIIGTIGSNVMRTILEGITDGK